MEEDSEINGLLLGIMENYSDSVIPSLSELSLPPTLPQTDSTAILARSFSSPKKRGRPKVRENIDAGNNGKRSRLQNVLHGTNTYAKQKRERSQKVCGKKHVYLMKEKDRRQKMSDSYDILQSLVPINLLPKDQRDLFKDKKATRERIVSGTIASIESLEKEITRLEGMMIKRLKTSSTSWKLGSMCTTSRNSSVNIMVSSEVFFFGIQATAKQGLVTQIFRIFQRHKSEILDANVVANNRQLRLTVTATTNGNADKINERITRDILNL